MVTMGCEVRAAAATSVGMGREKYKGKRRSKEPREERASRLDVLEEDIYIIKYGWSVHIDPVEEMNKIARVQVSVRLEQQLQNERQSNARNRTSNKAAAPVVAPRLTHKLLRVMAGSVVGKKLTSCADLRV
ncbi:hypothetical protein AXG93_1962s1600 [Marchantia polymorpha subsp. ruderalis]|uniref:Uncharacterized protein n=1 Tax=Marchantia polymorpha subsp. ruderalis TaxID=1480154 RepID=A0A176WF87_MARPO|nr:hypothetical protein AXG93_1962s1600 [Marchantia polymorpha subsp. ruderalis]